MTTEQQKQIQQHIIDYFKEYDNDVFVAIIDSFVYQERATKNVSEIIEKFLTDNQLTDAYVNYISDQKDQKFFNRTSMSQGAMIDTIKTALLNASFNRLRKTIDETRKFKKLKKDFKEIKEGIEKIMDAGSVERFDEGMDDLKWHYLEWQKKK